MFWPMYNPCCVRNCLICGVSIPLGEDSHFWADYENNKDIVSAPVICFPCVKKQKIDEIQMILYELGQ